VENTSSSLKTYL